jgi:hypothetical protein
MLVCTSCNQPELVSASALMAWLPETVGSCWPHHGSACDERSALGAGNPVGRTFRAVALGMRRAAGQLKSAAWRQVLGLPGAGQPHLALGHHGLGIEGVGMGFQLGVGIPGARKDLVGAVGQCLLFEGFKSDGEHDGY